MCWLRGDNPALIATAPDSITGLICARLTLTAVRLAGRCGVRDSGALR